MERLADDLWRIVFAFAGPAAGARQVAARARTLDEFVEYRLATAPDHSYERTTIQDGIANTCAHVKLVHALRIVSKQWRDIITYGSARQLTLKADSCVDLPSDEEGDDFERAASIHWWHARCGHDWWDFVFFAPPPEDYIF
jgi:hypothetical protein